MATQQTLPNSPIWLSNPLEQGYVQRWLVAGPLAQPIEDLAQYDANNLKAAIANHYHTTQYAITQPPLERTQLHLNDEEQDDQWHVVSCGDDHFVNCSDFYHTCHYLQTWAFCQLESPIEQEVRLALTTNGPADLWLHEQHILQTTDFHHQLPSSTEFRVQLQAGSNPLMVRFVSVAVRESPNVMALQVVDHYDLPELQS